MIEDPEKAGRLICAHLDEFGREFKFSGCLFLSLAGPDLLCDLEEDSVALSSYRMITDRDCDKLEGRIRNRLRSELLPDEGPERILLDLFPIEYHPNDYQFMDHRPVGLIATALSLKAVAVTVSRDLLENIDHAAKRSGRPAKGHVVWPLAVSRSTLCPAERMGGVALVNLASQSTSLAILLGDHLLQTTTYPYGQDAITRDLCAALCLEDQNEAERIMRKAGLDIEALEENKETLQIVTGPEGGMKTYYRKHIAQVIYQRFCEIAEWVAATLRDSPFRDRVTEGLVLVGEGAGMEGATDLFSLHTGLHARVGDLAGRAGKSGGPENSVYSIVAGVGPYVDENRERYIKSLGIMRLATRSEKRSFLRHPAAALKQPPVVPSEIAEPEEQEKRRIEA